MAGSAEARIGCTDPVVLQEFPLSAQPPDAARTPLGADVTVSSRGWL